MIVYSFEYCPCIHESLNAIVSLHFSRDGAEKAMKKHKAKKRREFNKMFGNDNEFNFKFGEHEYWGIYEVEVLP